jgi:hypothetical protein
MFLRRKRSPTQIEGAWVLLGLALVFCGSVGCEKPRTVEIELDAFSGKPNPKWELSLFEASDLMSRVASLSEIQERVPQPGLGYRGFVLSSSGRSLRVYKGYVIVEQGGSTHVYRDTAGIEAQLAADARSRGHGTVVEGVARENNSSKDQ